MTAASGTNTPIPVWLSKPASAVTKTASLAISDFSKTLDGLDIIWSWLPRISEFNPVCTGMLKLRGKLTYDDLMELVNGLSQRARYRQRIVNRTGSWAGAVFEEDPNFDPKKHISIVHLPDDVSRERVEEIIANYIAMDWDYSRPLWDIMFLENYRDETGAQCALIIRGHHAISDGQGFIQSQLFMTSFKAELEKATSEAAKTYAAARNGLLAPSKINKSLQPLDRYADNVYTAPVLQFFMIVLFDLLRLYSFIIGSLWGIWHVLATTFMFSLTFWRCEKVTPYYSGPRVAGKEFSHSKSYSIENVKLCQKAFSGKWKGQRVNAKGPHARGPGHVTLNDILVACMADVVAVEVRNHAKPPKSWWKRTVQNTLPSTNSFFIPISYREPGDISLRNFSAGAIAYIAPSSDPGVTPTAKQIHEHIHKARRELTTVKKSLAPWFGIKSVSILPKLLYILSVPLTILAAIPGVSSVSHRFIAFLSDISQTSFTAILTNVPGGKKPATLSGIEILSWHVLPPQAGKGTLAIGLNSYGGSISLAVSADCVPGYEGVARRICDRFEKRFELYVQRAREVLSE